MAKGNKAAPVKHTGRMFTAWREGMGYSLADAAEALGMPEADLASIEKADDMPPRYIRLAMSALGLGMIPEGDTVSPAEASDEG